MRPWWRILLLVMALPRAGETIPAFARKYGISCNVCHKAVPHLNAFGQQFAEGGYIFGDVDQGTLTTGDDELHLPEYPPVAFRFTFWGEGRTFGEARADFQAPYAVKILSGAPLGERVRFYSYVIFEKGEPPRFEDAWVELHNLPGEISLTLGQFQISDLMFMREVRLTRSDYMIYRVAPAGNGFALTYHRGILLGLPWFSTVLGVVNGNGIGEAEPIGGPGSARPYRDFDNNADKVFFGHTVLPLPGLPVGLFGLWGQDGMTDSAGVLRTNRFIRAGVDIAYDAGAWDVFFQGLWGEDENPYYQAGGVKKTFYGGFAGLNWVGSYPVVISLLANFVDSPENDVTYRAIRTRTVAINLSHYLYRNARVFLELQGDVLAKDAVHQEQEHLVTLGVDVAL